jgi:ATP-dependent RNA helicase DHX36
MLMYGVIFDCLDPILTVACALAYRDPWVLPVSSDGRRRASAIKRSFAEKGGSGGSSDHMATIAAFAQFSHVERNGDAWGFCNSNFLSAPTLRMIKGMRDQLVNELASRGFIASLPKASGNATNPELVRSTIACGLYPNYGRIGTNHPNERNPKPSMVNNQNVRVRIHPCSVNSTLSNPVVDQDDLGRSTVLVYDELLRGDARVNVKSTTEANPHAIILFASAINLRRADDEDERHDVQAMGDLSANIGSINDVRSIARLGRGYVLLEVDQFLNFRMPTISAVCLALLRARCISAFAYRASHARQQLPEALREAVRLATGIFLHDGKPFSSHGAYLHPSFADGNQGPTMDGRGEPPRGGRVGHGGQGSRGGYGGRGRHRGRGRGHRG